MRAIAAGVVRGVFLCGALITLVGCQNKNPASPSPPLSTAAGSITIGGTTVLNNPGETSQLTATGMSSDGTTKDLTNVVAVWSGGHGVVTVRGGLLTAEEYGRGLIKVTAEGLVQSMPVRVLPEGMFLLQGRVAESGGPPGAGPSRGHVGLRHGERQGRRHDVQRKLVVRSATGPGTLAECTASDHRLELVR